MQKEEKFKRTTENKIGTFTFYVFVSVSVESSLTCFFVLYPPVKLLFTRLGISVVAARFFLSDKEEEGMLFRAPTMIKTTRYL